MFSSLETFMPYIWLAVIVFSVIIEAITVKHIFVTMLPAAMLSLIISLAGFPISSQMTAFTSFFALLLLLRLTFFENLIRRRNKAEADKLIGQTAVVVKTISESHKGRILINGKQWPAVAGEGKTFVHGDTVSLLEYSSNRFVCG
ncbi:MAG: NfeD family protein [Eubacteriales bacterium]|jgi:membrane protein implicated in regulation of membrane protease activity